MKITFSNLGAIKKTTLDLRPLTVIIGPNNSNKTYIAYSIYGLWLSILQTPAYLHFSPKKIKQTEKSFSLKIDDVLIEEFIKYYKEKAADFKKKLPVFFQDTQGRLFKKTVFDIDITKDEVKKAIYSLAESKIIQLQLQYKFQFKKDVLHIDVESIDSKLKDFKITQIDFFFLFTWEITERIFGESIVLPAERSAFMITYKVLANRRFQLLRNTRRENLKDFLKNSEMQLKLPLDFAEDIRYPQPIEDFLDFLTNIEFGLSTEKVNEFAEIAKYIELYIQDDNKVDYKLNQLNGKDFFIAVNTELNIDVHNASSSIKQLAPLILYLRYRAETNNFLIIDEPEMNLHPESQAKLLEVLAMLVNAGVNVLLTTHSPYFMSHLNNLIAGDMTDEKTREKQAKSLYLEDVRAFLEPEDVSAYEMRLDKTGKHQELHNLYDKDYGIRWDTLSDVSADIQQKFFEIYEQKETTSNGEEEK